MGLPARPTLIPRVQCSSCCVRLVDCSVAADEAISAVAAAAASIVAGAMATVRWDAVRNEVLRLWPSPSAPDRDAVARQLDRGAELVASATDRTGVRDQVAAVLTVELLRHLAQNPERVSELERIADSTGPATPSLGQHNTAGGGGQIFAVQHGDLHHHAADIPPWPPQRTGDDSEGR